MQISLFWICWIFSVKYSTGERLPLVSDTLLGSFLYVLFLLLGVIFVYSLPLPKWSACGMVPVKIYLLLWVVFCVMISWLNDRKYENLLQFNTTRFFYKNTFSTQRQCCLAFLWIEFQMLLKCCLIHKTSVIRLYFIFSIFVSVSRSMSIYIVHTWSVFHFQPHFHCH